MGDHELKRHQGRQRHTASDSVMHPGKSTQAAADTAAWDGQPYFERYEQIVEGRLADAQNIQPGEAESIRNALARERAALQELMVKLPTGSPLMRRGFKASDRITALIVRLDSVTRAQNAKVATAADAAKGDEDQIFASAAEKIPLGFCDTAPQQRAPCNLEPTRRDAYRRTIRSAVATMHTNYGLAINAVKVDEKLRSKEVPFEQVLGELLLGVLFQGMTLLAKAAVQKGIGVAEKALTTTERIEEAGIVAEIRPDAHAVATARKIGDNVVETGMGKLKAEATQEGVPQQAISTAELAARASAGFAVPADRDGFLELLKTAPTNWAANISSNLDYLFDVDLAALVIGLSKKVDDITQPSYEKRIRELLQRFDAEVMSLDGYSEMTTTMVALPDGTVRQAVIYPEKAANGSLQGEWKNSKTNTGKWSFVCWIGDDMRGLAVAKATRRDPLAAGRVRWGGDAKFWDEAALRRFAAPDSTSEAER